MLRIRPLPRARRGEEPVFEEGEKVREARRGINAECRMQTAERRMQNAECITQNEIMRYHPFWGQTTIVEILGGAYQNVIQHQIRSFSGD